METPGGPPTGHSSGETGRHVHTRRVYISLAIGIGLGSSYTAVQVAGFGYQILPFTLLWNLIWAPLLGVVIGQAPGRTRPERPGKWKIRRVHAGTWTVIVASLALLLGPHPFPFVGNLIWVLFLGASIGLALSLARPERPRGWRPLQLRVQTLMVIVAYLAILLGGGVSTSRIGFAARRYWQKAINSAEMVRIYRDQARKCDVDAGLRRANVAELRAGKIPEGLLPIQREFLQSLEDDPKVVPEFRTYRRGLITEAEEEERILQEENTALCGRIAEHFAKLAAKYERARWHPWLPVEPDPPVPD